MVAKAHEAGFKEVTYDRVYKVRNSSKLEYAKSASGRPAEVVSVGIVTPPAENSLQLLKQLVIKHGTIASRSVLEQIESQASSLGA
jgi:hypothetical protein